MAVPGLLEAGDMQEGGQTVDGPVAILWALGLGCALVWVIGLIDVIVFRSVGNPEFVRYATALFVAAGVLRFRSRRTGLKSGRP